MSEQTPESTIDAEHTGEFASSDAEPSMEDILASIRKIISDDSDPVPLAGPADEAPSALAPKSEPDMRSAEDNPAETVEAAKSETIDEGVVETSSNISDMDFDIEALIGDFEKTSSEDDLIIPEIEEDSTQSAIEDPVPVPDPVDTDVPDMDDMDRLMNDMLMEMETSELVDSDVVEPTVSSQSAPVVSAVSDDNDIDLVKSLMEGLTDEDLIPEDISSEDLSVANAKSEEKVSTSEPVEVPLDVLDAMEDDIFDTILDMTIEDEVQATISTSTISDSDTSIPSLADIAAAAEAEAKPEPIQPVEAAAALGGATLAASGTPVVTETTKVPTAQAAPATASGKQADPNTQKSDIQEMETPMPSALRSDAILDDVTEQATIGAFAQLNQVVEDKAVLSERGPRIGDLVQEALRPMLKDWLDENLQGIVERAVAKEVKRLSAGK